MFYNDFAEFTILILQTAEKRSRMYPGDPDGRTYAIMACSYLFTPPRHNSTRLN